MSEENNEEDHPGDFALDMGKICVPAVEIHCPGCRRFLGYQAIAWGVVKLKCPNCKKWTMLDVSPEN